MKSPAISGGSACSWLAMWSSTAGWVERRASARASSVNSARDRVAIGGIEVPRAARERPGDRVDRPDAQRDAAAIEALADERRRPAHRDVGHQLRGPELVGDHDVDRRRGRHAAGAVAAGRRVDRAVLVADRVHRDAVDDREPVAQVEQLADRRAEPDRRAGPGHDLEAVSGRLPVLQAADVGVARRGRLDQALALVARIGPQRDVPAAAGVDEDEEVVGQGGGRGPGRAQRGRRGAAGEQLERVAAPHQ